jgi:hypothetical protein
MQQNTPPVSPRVEEEENDDDTFNPDEFEEIDDINDIPFGDSGSDEEPMNGEKSLIFSINFKS